MVEGSIHGRSMNYAYIAMNIHSMDIHMDIHAWLSVYKKNVDIQS